MKRESQPSETELQAFVDGELSVEEAASLQAVLDGDPELQRKLEALRRVRDLVDDALAADDDGAAPAAAPMPRVRGRGRTPGRLWAAALIPAAAAVVVAVALLSRPKAEPDQPARWQENDVLAARCVPLRGGSWPLFSDMAIRLDLRSLDGRPIRVLSWPEDRDETAVFADADDRELSVAIEARITKPGSRHLEARLVLPEPVAVGTEGSLELPLRRLRVRDQGVVPYFGLRPEQGGWHEDFQWTFGAFGAPALRPWRPFVPEEPGEYAIELRLTSPWYMGTLDTATVVRVTGAVSDWSAEHDGLRFRLAAPSPELRPGSLWPLALQIENVGGTELKYNVMGVTRAAVPQPYHFTLLVDGEDWDQREDLATLMSGDMFFVPQPPGTLRTVVVAPAFWQQDGSDLEAMPGAHDLQLRFDFTASLVKAGEPVWQGTALTPVLKVTVRDE